MDDELKLTTHEVRIVELLAEAWNEFLQLPDLPIASDKVEFMTAIHSAQAQVLMRTGRRQLYDQSRKQHGD